MFATSHDLLHDTTSRRALALAVAVDATILDENPQAIDVLRAIVRDSRSSDPVDDAIWSIGKRTVAKLTGEYEMLPKQAEALAKAGLQRVMPALEGAALSTRQVALASDFAARAIAWRADPNLMHRHEALLTQISREMASPGGAMKWAGKVNETHVLGEAGYQRSTPLLAVRIFKGQLAAQPTVAPQPGAKPQISAPTPAQPAVQPEGMKRLMGGMNEVKMAMAGGRKRAGFWNADRLDTPETTPSAQPMRAAGRS